MKAHQHIAKALGQKRLATALGVGLTAVNNALAREHFPARWYPVIRDLCAAHGVLCSEEAFNFKSPSQGGPEVLACRQRLAAGENDNKIDAVEKIPHEGDA